MDEKPTRKPRKPKAASPQGPPTRTRKAAPKDGSAAPPRTPRARKPAEAAKPKVPEAEQPKQKLGDTPVAPWAMPTPAEKTAAEPVKKALDEALQQVTTPEKAEQVIDNLEAAFGDQKAKDVAPQPKSKPAKEDAKSVEKAAVAVKEAAQSAPAELKPEAVIAETAKVVEQAKGPAKEAASEAVQEVLNPQQQGVPDEDNRLSWRRRLLQQAQLHRLKPLDAVDARLYIAINHLPHNRLLNGFFYFITFVFTGGWAWYIILAVTMAAQKRPKLKQFRGLSVAMTAATLIVEFPVKHFFRRRRPFIDIVRAIVIGKKPGTWSFPSGHSASAFGGAWVMRQFFPKLTPLFYAIAALVGFSRIYLGDHYPGDVLSGSIIGHTLAMTFGKMLKIKRRRKRRLW
jgi:undecaprenyl-diphosphatase